LDTSAADEQKRLLKEAAEVIYQCTLCGQCTAWCGKSRDIATNMIAGRTDVVEAGFAPKEVLNIDQLTKKEHNPYGEGHSARMDNLSDRLRKKLQKKNKGKVGLWLGCTMLYYQPEMVGAFTDLMEAADIDYQVLNGDEWCCGLPQYKLGLRETAKDLADHNLSALDKKGIETLVVDCPECYRSFNDFYPEMGKKYKGNVIHSSEFFADLIKKDKIKFSKNINKTVTYHDPCELARHTTPSVRTEKNTSDIFDPPREILEAIPGIKLEEMRWTKEKTFCCGGSVSLKELYPDVSKLIGKKVPSEAEKIANTLVVACPECKKQFLATRSDENLEIVSLLELASKAI
jgi:heterodisulfide reductase subunit D